MRKQFLIFLLVVMTGVLLTAACGSVTDPLRGRPTQTPEQVKEAARVAKCEKALEEDPRKVVFETYVRQDLMIPLDDPDIAIFDISLTEPEENECKNNIRLGVIGTSIGEGFFPKLDRLLVTDYIRVKILVSGEKPMIVDMQSSKTNAAIAVIQNFTGIENIEGIEVSMRDLTPYPMIVVEKVGSTYWRVKMEYLSPFWGW
jgi:hypothetical protein